MTVEYCKKCIMPSTKPSLSFDDEGICDACRAAEAKDEIDWKARKKELEELLDKYRNNDPKKYDCIVAVSGGKDSTFQVLVMKKIYKMNVLCVQFDPTTPSEVGRHNLENLRTLGVDLISLKANSVVNNRLCREGFVRVGDHEWPNHIGICAAVARLAVQLNIPLIIWGENTQLEYGGGVKLYGGIKELTTKNVLDKEYAEKIGDWFVMNKGHLDELGVEEEAQQMYFYPSEEELKKAKIHGIFLGYYLKWNARRHVELDKKYGWRLKDTPVEGTYSRYENLDDVLYPVHDYLKYLKFGFSRASDSACIDIHCNSKRLTRRNALILAARYDGVLSENTIEMFCKRFDMTKKEFFEVLEKYANKTIFKTDKNGKLVWENGRVIHLELEKELEREGISKEECKDTSAIEEEIEKQLKEEIKNGGYVHELIYENSEIVKNAPK